MFRESGGWRFFLARGEGRAGVVLIHEIFGHTPYAESVASGLASRGFSTAAIDLYRGQKASTIEEGFRLRSSVTRESLLEGVSRGATLLREVAGSKSVGTMGFCMGGGFALQAACNLPLDFCVDYYGSIENEEDVAGLKCPVLLILGEDDERVTPWALQKFLPVATRNKKRVEVQLYPNARHAFHRPGWEGHNPAAAEDAWDKTLRFLSAF